MTDDELIYEPIPWMSKREINSVIRNNEPGVLSIAVLSAALYSGDGIWAEKICYKLVQHPHANVRGNALQSLGHIARVHGTLDRKRAIKLLQAALNDEHEDVRGNAYNALEDVKHYIKRNGRWVGHP